MTELLIEEELDQAIEYATLTAEIESGVGVVMQKQHDAGIALFVRMHSQGPDGLTMDTAANLVIAHPYHGAIWLYNPDAAPLYCLTAPRDKMTTNIAYGGADNKTLFIVKSALCAISRVSLPVPDRRCSPTPSHWLWAGAPP